MATHKTASAPHRAVSHSQCHVCPRGSPGAFCHPQDVIDTVLQRVDAVDTAKPALAVALHWLEELVSRLACVYMQHAARETA